MVRLGEMVVTNGQPFVQGNHSLIRNAPPIRCAPHPHSHPANTHKPKILPTLSLFVAGSGLIYCTTTLHALPQPKTLNPQAFTAYPTFTSKAPVATSPPGHITLPYSAYNPWTLLVSNCGSPKGYNRCRLSSRSSGSPDHSPRYLVKPMKRAVGR